MEGINLIRIVGSSCAAQGGSKGRLFQPPLPSLFRIYIRVDATTKPLENGIRDLETLLIIGC